MPRRSPDHRAVTVVSMREPPEHPLERALWLARRGQTADAAVIRALELSAGKACDCVRGWLLSTSNDDEISRRTRLSTDVIGAFRHLFFDVQVFRDHIDLIEWVREVSEAPGAVPGSTQYVRWAVMYGIEAVAYLSGLPVAIDPAVVQTQAMIDGHFKSLMGREAGLDSGVAREALKHQQMAVTQAAVLSKKAPMTESVALKIKHREMTSPIEFVDKTAEVLH